MYYEKKKVKFLKISIYFNLYFCKEMFEYKDFCDLLDEINERKINLYKIRFVKDDVERFFIR